MKMFKKIGIAAAVAIISLLFVYTTRAWVSPQFEPPAGNTAAPLNVGVGPQTKEGDLRIGDGLAISGGSGVFSLKNESGVFQITVAQSGSVAADKKINSPQVCINGDCRSEWISGNCPADKRMVGIDEKGKIICEALPAKCSCGAWKDDGCGKGGCAETEIRQTRTCVPGGCELNSRCVVSDDCASGGSCDTTIKRQTCVNGDVYFVDGCGNVGEMYNDCHAAGCTSCLRGKNWDVCWNCPPAGCQTDLSQCNCNGNCTGFNCIDNCGDQCFWIWDPNCRGG